MQMNAPLAIVCSRLSLFPLFPNGPPIRARAVENVTCYESTSWTKLCSVAYWHPVQQSYLAPWQHQCSSRQMPPGSCRVLPGSKHKTIDVTHLAHDGVFLHHSTTLHAETVSGRGIVFDDSSSAISTYCLEQDISCPYPWPLYESGNNLPSL